MITDERPETTAPDTPRDRAFPWPPSLWQAVALVVALCFLSGVVGWWIAQPGDEPFNRVDVGFLSDMTTHHGGAITMSFTYLGREHDSLVGHFAREIVLTQTQEITIMNGLAGEAGDSTRTRDDIAMDWMGMPVPRADARHGDHHRDGRAGASQGITADDEFTRLMIRHHAAGVAMATTRSSTARTPRSNASRWRWPECNAQRSPR